MPKKAEKKPAQELSVTADEAGMRLDRWVRRHFPEVTQGHVQKLLRTGQLRLAGKRAEAAARLESGQLIRVPPVLLAEKAASQKGEPVLPAAKKKRLQSWILFEDADVIVLNKPAGLAVQGGTGLKESLDDLLMALSLDGVRRPKLVHRLDRETSGVLLVARNAFAAARLTEAFRERTTQKIYWAVTLGKPKRAKGEMDAPLIKEGEVMRIATPADQGAKEAATLYQTLASNAMGLSFIALAPLTGRTHQLRVHLANLGCPIYGDRLYGGAEIPSDKPELQEKQKQLGKGLHLHARRLIVPHPRGGTLDVIAPLSDEMRKTWRALHFEEEETFLFNILAEKQKRRQREKTLKA